MLTIGALIVILILLVRLQYARFKAKRRKLTDAISKLPGPPEASMPVLANIINIFRYEIAVGGQFDTYVLIYHELMSNCHIFEKEGIHHFWMSWIPVVMVHSPNTIEPILTSSTLLTKAENYFVIEPWIGQGLITSKGDLWRTRRKIITPGFHFNILNDFLPTMNSSATVLIKKLNNIKCTCAFNLNAPISQCTLDVISRTAMGVDLDCQASEESEYGKALDEVQRLALFRLTRVWLWPDWLFYRTAIGKKFVKARDLIYDLTHKIIEERKKEWEALLRSQRHESVVENGAIGGSSFEDILRSKSFKQSRMRLAFLDLLLHQHLVEKNLTIKGIIEEVNTFMFAGHDTTATLSTWTLYHLGRHPDIQAKVRAELDRVLGDQEEDEEEEFEFDCVKICQKLKTTDITVEHISKMKYLDMVIKETLRLTPTAPLVARKMTEDVMVDGKYLVPAGSTCVVFIHALHLNPTVFKDPYKFDPERFSPENSLKRSPFSYVPFSAGPRNCIGRKFAILEAKVILAKVIRNYFVEANKPFDKLRFISEVILKSDVKLDFRLRPRFGYQQQQ